MLPDVGRADGRSLAGSIRQRGKLDPLFVEELGDVIGILDGVLKPDDFLLVQGAGSVGRLVSEICNWSAAEGAA